MLIARILTPTLGLALLTLYAAHAGQGGSAPTKDAAEEKSLAAVKAWLHQITSAESAKEAVTIEPKIEPVEGGAVRRVFASDRYYAVHYMRYPRAVAAPKPLKQDNLVRVRPNGSVERIEDLDALKKSFAENLPPVRDEAQARAAVLAFLPLAVEFEHHGRGRYTFDVPESGVTASREGDHWTATGKAVASTGGEGVVSATLTFDASGKLNPDAFKINAKLRPRPGGRSL